MNLNNNLTLRIISAASILVVFFFSLMFVQDSGVLGALAKLLIFALIAVSTFELYGLLNKKYQVFYSAITLIPVVVHFIALSCSSYKSFNIFSGFLIVAVYILTKEIYQNRDNFVLLTKKIALLLPTLMYLVSFAAFLLVLNSENYFNLTISLVVIVACTDTFAYFGGRAFGKTALAPAISPKKTIAGFVCGVIGAVIVGTYLFTELNSTSYTFSALISLLISVVAVLGDLLESFMKRVVGVKDSSNFLPGHGGFLDRFDGLLPGFICLLFLI